MRRLACLLLCFWNAAAQQSDTAETMRRAIEAQQRRDFAEAVKDFRLVLEKRPDLTEARVHLAAPLTKIGRLDEAISVLEPASGKPGVRRNLAIAYYRRNNLSA